MLTEQDLIDYSELTSQEIEVIAEMTNEPVVLSVAHAQMMLLDTQGVQTIKQYLKNAIEKAKLSGAVLHVVELQEILAAFEKAHP